MNEDQQMKISNPPEIVLDHGSDPYALWCSSGCRMCLVLLIYTFTIWFLDLGDNFDSCITTTLTLFLSSSGSSQCCILHDLQFANAG